MLTFFIGFNFVPVYTILELGFEVLKEFLDKLGWWERLRKAIAGFAERLLVIYPLRCNI